MRREFLKNFQVNGQPLPKELIDAIMEENGRDIEAAKAGAGGKLFTQEEVERMVSQRLARDRSASPEDERERALRAREARLDCRDYLDSKKYPAALLDVLDTADVDKFKAAVGVMVDKFPTIARADEVPPPYAAGTGTQRPSLLFRFHNDPIAEAFKPKD